MQYINPPGAPAVTFAYPVAFAQSSIAKACHVWGEGLTLPKGIDGAKLLWAISGCESTFGYDCKPRHEAGYCSGGTYGADPDVLALTAKLGHLAHCSVGPWQLMLANWVGITDTTAFDLDTCASQTVRFINRRILGQQHAMTLSEIFDSYNSGNFRDKNVPVAYMAKGNRYYASVPLPALPA